MANEQLTKLKLQRSFLKGTVTRIENFVNDPIQFSAASAEMLQARKDKLVSTLKEYEKLQLDILSLDSNDKESVEAMEEKYFVLVSKLNQSLNKLNESCGCFKAT